MRPGWIGSLSRTWAAGSGPWRRRISGRALVPVAGRWRTTNTAAERSLGSEAARSTSASTPPAEAPTTTMPWSGMTGLLNTGAGRVADVGPATLDRSYRPGWPGAAIMMRARRFAVHDEARPAYAVAARRSASALRCARTLRISLSRVLRL